MVTLSRWKCCLFASTAKLASSNRQAAANRRALASCCTANWTTSRSALSVCVLCVLRRENPKKAYPPPSQTCVGSRKLPTPPDPCLVLPAPPPMQEIGTATYR
eukprot:358957-Amphidinium_carterae.1